MSPLPFLKYVIKSHKNQSFIFNRVINHRIKKGQKLKVFDPFRSNISKIILTLSKMERQFINYIVLDIFYLTPYYINYNFYT